MTDNTDWCCQMAAADGKCRTGWPCPKNGASAQASSQPLNAPQQAPLEVILDARGARYGAFIDNAQIAQLIKQNMRQGKAWMTMPNDGKEALEQIACKISRLVTGDPNYVDNWDDVAGYATCVAKRLRETK